MIALTPYEEMNSLEIVTYWARLDIKAPGGLSVFKSPNKALWAFVDEKRLVTLVMWDTHTSHVYREEKPEEERVEACPVCGLPPDLCVCAELKRDMLRRRYATLAKPAEEKLSRGNWTTCDGCPDVEKRPLHGYDWTCRLRGLGVFSGFGCTRDIFLKHLKEAQP